MRTIYNKSNANFSNLAHACAKILIYPEIFETGNLKYESTLLGGSEKNNILDGELAIDRIIHVISKDNKLKGPLKFTIQERFRRINYSNYRDLTITEWNYNSDLPSELYKISSGMFLYGYFDPVNLFFGEVILINTIDLLFQMSQGSLDYRMGKNHKNQTFLTIPFDNLTCIFHRKCSDKINFDVSLANPALANQYNINVSEAALLKRILKENVT